MEMDGSQAEALATFAASTGAWCEARFHLDHQRIQRVIEVARA